MKKVKIEKLVSDVSIYMKEKNVIAAEACRQLGIKPKLYYSAKHAVIKKINKRKSSFADLREMRKKAHKKILSSIPKMITLESDISRKSENVLMFYGPEEAVAKLAKQFMEV